MNIRPLLLVAIMMVTSLAGCTSTHEFKPQTSESLVLRSLETIKSIKNGEKFKNFKDMLSDAAGCAIFPALYKAGFFVGAEGGNGVIIARDRQGNWGYPAFYTLASASWGLQFGAQKAGVVLVIRNRGAIESILQNQGKFGADVSFAVGPVGTGVEGAITTNLAADIIAFSDVKGLFAGMSLEGAGIIRRNDLNLEYYGKEVTPDSILLQHSHQNVQANPLRTSLIIQ